MNIIHTVYLNLDSSYLRGVSGGHLVQLQLKSPSSKSKSPSPTQLRLVGLGDLGMDSGDLSGVGQVHLPPLSAVGLMPKLGKT